MGEATRVYNRTMAAQKLGISEATVLRHQREGKLKAYYIGADLFYLAAEVEALNARRKRGKQGSKKTGKGIAKES